MMQNYVSIPTPIKAIQITSDNAKDILDYLQKNNTHARYRVDQITSQKIKGIVCATRHGDTYSRFGDYLIQHDDNTFDIYGEAYFHMNFSKVEPERETPLADGQQFTLPLVPNA